MAVAAFPASQLLASSSAQFVQDVRDGLTKPGQKELPSKYLYDEVGSALFEVITTLPEYGLTRADARLLQRCSASLAERIPAPVAVAELGSGTGSKTRFILEHLADRCQVSYYPIDVSAAALAAAERSLSTFAHVTPVEASYLEGLEVVAARRYSNQKLLVLFLGSTIGNFTRPAQADFLAGVRSYLRPGDRLLLGTDLVKPIDQLLEAYDDPLGVTAAFNLNLLARINRELGGTFDLADWEHMAIYSTQEKRIEMHLRALCCQRIAIEAPDLRISFEQDETIWTESSYKFEPSELDELAFRTGFLTEERWTDAEWPFAENLWIADHCA